MKHYYHIIAENQPIYALGDLHGDWDSLLREIKNKTISDCSFVILGDIGLGFHKKEYHINKLREINNQLKKRNLYLYLFRGNHDDPQYFNRKINENDELILSNVKVLPDYTVLTTNNKNILLIGGATSIDRLYRIQTYNKTIKDWLSLHPKLKEKDAKKEILPIYWKDEQPFFNTVALDELTKDGLTISAVLTHTCPSFSYPITKEGIKSWLKIDSKLNMDISFERSVMDSIYHYLKDLNHNIKEWIYGHYHCHYEMIHDNILFTTLFNTDERFDSFEILRENREE